MNALEAIIDALEYAYQTGPYRVVRFRVTPAAIRGVTIATPVLDGGEPMFKRRDYEILLHPMDALEAKKLRDPVTGTYPWEHYSVGEPTLYSIPVVREV